MIANRHKEKEHEGMAKPSSSAHGTGTEGGMKRIDDYWPSHGLGKAQDESKNMAC